MVPLLKKGKTPTEVKSYRSINILPSIGKILDKVVSNQILEHLVENSLIPHEHHGGVGGNNTITAIATMVDQWAYSIENNQSLAIIILDQTAAYDLISHPILLKKMQYLGFDEHTMDYFQSYLADRSQVTLVDGTMSQELYSGPMSVIQGSVLSCLLFLLYTLDLPLLFTQTRVTIENYEQDTLPKPTTFVDDVVATCRIDNNIQSQQRLDIYMDKFQNYMSSNKLLLNREKTQLLILTDKPGLREKMFFDSRAKKCCAKKGFHLFRN